VTAFANWLAATPASVWIASHDWVIPTVQSLHIAAISIALVSAFMIGFRVLGWISSDQTLEQTSARFLPWLAGSLVVLLVTGGLMVLGEPARELLAFSFWLKMCLIVVATLLTWRAGCSQMKPLTIVTLLLWIFVIFLGRLIAYDHIWGSWSGSMKA
jgi:hypothetical protein